MDPSSIFSSVTAVKSASRISGNKLVLVSPYMFLCSYIPSLALIILSAYIALKHGGPETEMQCLSVKRYTVAHSNMICLRESFAVLDIQQRQLLRIPKHPVVGQRLRDSETKEMNQLVYIQPMLILCGLVYFLPPVFWKFCFFSNRVHEVVNLMSPSTGVRGEHVGDDENRRLKDLKVTLNVLFSRRGQFARAHFWSEILIPCCNAMVLLMLTITIGPEYLTYGYSALFYPYLHNSHVRVQDLLFPTKMACRLEHVGPSGSLVTEYSMCFFPAGDVYQYTFIGIWWLTVAQFIWIAFNLCVMFSKRFRKVRTVYLARWVPEDDKVTAVELGNSTDYSAWLLLDCILKNITIASMPKFLPIAVEVWESRKSRHMGADQERARSNDEDTTLL